MQSTEVDRFERDVCDRLKELDADILQLAERSQRAERMGLQGGEVAPVRGSREIVGDYQEQARRAEHDARLDILIAADRLIDRAKDTATEDAPAETLQNVEFALKHNLLSDTELAAAYEKHAHQWVLERVLRQEMAKRRLPISNPNVASIVLQAQDEIKARAAQAAGGRWEGAGSVVHTSVSPAGIEAAYVADAARHVPSDFMQLLESL